MNGKIMHHGTMELYYYLYDCELIFLVNSSLIDGIQFKVEWIPVAHFTDVD